MENEKLKFKASFNIEVVEAAARQNTADNYEETIFGMPIVGMDDVRPNGKIWGIKSMPINDKVKSKKPSTLRYYAVHPVKVTSFATDVKAGFCVVNGTVDIPDTAAGFKGLSGCYLASQEDAKAVCEVLSRLELERAQDYVEEAGKAVIFLEDQIKNDRY